MHQPNESDPDLIVDAVAYVTELRDEVEREVGPLRPGTGREVLAMVLADPALSQYMRRWARHTRSFESKVGPVRYLPMDATYDRLRSSMLALGGADRKEAAEAEGN
jgi:hypothetical protein